MKISVKILGIALAASLCFLSCSSSQKETQELITLMEAADKNQEDTTICAAFVRKTAAFIEKNPQHKLDSTLLYRAGQYAFFLARINRLTFEKSSVFGKNAILFFDALMNLYPDFSEMELCYLNKIEIYEGLGNLTKAENQYREFIEKYPEHPLTPDFRIYVDHFLGKSEEQMMAEILKKNKDNPDIKDVPVEHVKTEVDLIKDKSQ